MPLISVIIPVYNGARTIRETIESVLNQTFSDFELIIINDGSTDSTLEVVESIQDSRIKVFSYTNAGQPASRNRGIAKAVGEYISFIDADDLWTAEKLEYQLKALQNNPQAAVAYSWTNYIDETGKILNLGSHLTVEGDVFAPLFLSDFVGSGSNVLIRAQAFKEVGSFDESLSNAHDWDMWLKLAAKYHFVCVPKRQILYRISPGSMSSNVWGMEASCLRVIERAAEHLPDSLKHIKGLCFANRYKALTYKAIEGFPDRRRGLTAARFFWQAVIYDLNLLKTKVVWKVLFKIVTVVLLPQQFSKAVLTKLNKLSQVNALLVHIKTEVPAERNKFS